jgi:hypothetical protein
MERNINGNYCEAILKVEMAFSFLLIQCLLMTRFNNISKQFLDLLNSLGFSQLEEQMVDFHWQAIRVTYLGNINLLDFQAVQVGKKINSSAQIYCCLWNKPSVKGWTWINKWNIPPHHS